MAKEEAKQEEETSGKSGMVKMLLLGIGGLLILGLSIGAALYVTGFFDSKAEQPTEQVAKEGTAAKPAKQASKPVKTAQYLNLRPFTVSLGGQGGQRFLQITVSLMARSDAVLMAVKDHKPSVRNALTLLFSSQTPEALSTREGKLSLQKQAIEEIRKILLAEGMPAELKAVYFTNFVVD